MSLDPKKLLEIAATVQAEDDADVLILLQNTRLEFDDQRRVTKTVHTISKYLTRDAVRDNGLIEESWSPWYEKKPVIKARVISRRGFSRELKQSSIFERTPESDSTILHSDTRVLQAPLPTLSQGCLVETTVTTTESRSFFYPGTMHRVLVGAYNPVHKWSLTVVAPQSLNLKVSQPSNFDDIQPVTSTNNSRVTMRFQARDAREPWIFESCLPASASRFRHIRLGTGQSWQEVATEYSGLIEAKLKNLELDEMFGDLKDASIQDPNVEPTSIMEEALARIQTNVRYTGLEFGQSAIEPYHPGVTMDRGYGDCKDQATLLVAALRYLGIPSHVALVHAGYGNDADPEMPALNHFDHAIVVAEVGKRQIWIDPTVEFLPIGELPAQDQGKWSLIAAETTTELTRTPRMTAADNLTQRHIDFQLRELAPVITTIESTFHGLPGNEQRYALASGSKAEQKQSRQETLEYRYGASKTLDFEYSDVNDLETPLKVRSRFESNKYARVTLDEAWTWLFPDELLDDLPYTLHHGEFDDEQEERKFDFVLPKAVKAIHSYKITPPAGYSLIRLPKSDEISVGPIKIRTTYERVDNDILVKFELDTGNGILKPAEVAEFRQKIELLRERTGTDSWGILLEFHSDIARLVETKSYDKAVSAIQQLEKDHPETQAACKVRLSKLLLSLGLGKGARSLAKQATDDAPDSSQAWMNLAAVSVHGPLGRRLIRGFDFDTAAMAYKKVIEINGDDTPNSLYWTLGILYEHGPGGIRYCDPETLATAIEHYEKIVFKYQDAELTLNYTIALLAAGEYEKIIEYANTVELEGDSTAIYIAAVCAAEGINQGKAEMERLAEPEEDTSILKDRVASYLGFCGKYELSDRWLGYSSALEDGLFKLFTGGDKSAKRSDENNLITKPVLELIEWTFRDRFNLARLKPLFHEASDEEIQEFIGTLYPQNKNLSELTLGLLAERSLEQNSAAIDYTLSQAQISVSQRGFLNRIDVSWSEKWSDETTPTFHCYLIPANDDDPGRESKWKILLPGSIHDNIALHLFRRLQSKPRKSIVREIAETMDLIYRSEQASQPTHRFDPYHLSYNFRNAGQGSLKDRLRLACALLASSTGKKDVFHYLQKRADDFQGKQKIDIENAMFECAALFNDLTAAEELANEMRASPAHASRLDYRTKRLLLAKGDYEEYLLKITEDLTNAEAWNFYDVGRTHARAGNMELASTFYRRALNKQYQPRFANSYAWACVFLEKAPRWVLPIINRACEANPGAIYLHTSAAVHARLGRIEEAIELLKKSCDRRGIARYVEPDDDLVLGLIAEELGLPKVAIEYYQSSASIHDPNGDGDQSASLARKRLKILGVEPDSL